jgi:UDP-N-acetylmuramoylalanine--D-glutamate ligase
MYVMVGLGQTGLSVIRYLVEKNIPCAVCDSRLNPPGAELLAQNFPSIQYYFGELPEELLLQAQQIILSPGLSRSTPVIAKAILAGVAVIGDIELFVQAAKAPVIAITGTNAKGTVTTMLGGILTAAGLKVLLGGNIGTPALDLLCEEVPDYYVLELSSFQLESTFSLQAQAATILNISDDHLDYHGSLQNYILAKQRIYQNAKAIIVNQDDPQTAPLKSADSALMLSFGVNMPNQNQAFGIKNQQLLFHDQRIIDVAQLPVAGQHNCLNALAASALATAVGVSLAAIRQGLQNFRGLPHRCEFVLEREGIRWYNDSKGTNVGATLAALLGLGPNVSGRIVLIAGGQAKNQDFSPLQEPCQRYVKTLILFGQDAEQLDAALSANVAETIRVQDLAQAVKAAEQVSKADDIVLFSPACASLDMFKSYEKRGEQFVTLLKS